MDAASGRSSSDLLRDLAHDLRGPLGGIDSLSYYLEMISDHDDPRLGDHFNQMRRFVQQAAWLLDDATRFLDSAAQPRGEVCVNSVLSELASRLHEEDERTLDLHLTPALPAADLPLGHTQFAFDHLASFIHNIAGCPGLPAASTCLQEGQLGIEWNVLAPGWRHGELLRWLDPRQRGGGLRRFTESVGGVFRADDADGRLCVSFLFPSLH
jgi:signal transduction histidine kinase